MAQEDKNILLKDLCARLPYGFTIHRYSDNRDITFEPNKLDEFAHFLEYSEGEEFKPYLRPMSSMTKDEVKQYYKIRTGEDRNKPLGELDAELFDFYHKNHIDYRGLVPMGLALEAPEGMYEVHT
ncbi:MAG: hypothetical protein J6T10_13020 [Methanobrevibacter sp.]|nr:hypothetical protein [Methanobrevibacter sp.]